ncbi:biopolymer transport protein ExbD [Breznakibacter xylanolyticus]|uniref:Biopolymer transport protein ExbD n=1 Tax=Breznakibacter xylanolyticus TaxID=990 RepID=A0A2W7NBK6_9BACT|nr:biopolymer transporter ExbD [Breznakibacter xylanolyticus]PZX17370.1 biopolymer transport protein ExbD [Breznakibacter xylanolyticus]
MAKRAAPEINAGSMADIAFLLLIFFLITTTMGTDAGLARMLPPPLPPETEAPPPVNERNVFVVLLNSNNQLLVENQYMDIKELKRATKEFIENPFNKENLSEKKDQQIDFFGLYPVSKGIISLQNDRNTQYQAYLSVQNELQAAYNELRDELSKRKFGKGYADLDEEQQKAVREVYPQRISEAEPKNVGTKN